MGAQYYTLKDNAEISQPVWSEDGGDYRETTCDLWTQKLHNTWLEY